MGNVEKYNQDLRQRCVSARTLYTTRILLANKFLNSQKKQQEYFVIKVTLITYDHQKYKEYSYFLLRENIY